MRCTGAHMHPRYNRGATILGSLGKSHGWAYRTVPSGVNNIDNLIGVFQSPKTLIFKRIRLIPTTECSSPTVLIMCRTTTLLSGEISRQFQLNHFHTVCSSRAKAVSICDYHMMCVNILASNILADWSDRTNKLWDILGVFLGSTFCSNFVTVYL